MVSLLKTFARGILYVLGLPFFILALLIFAVIGLFAFLFQAIKSIIFFFTGQKFFPELPEDKELRLLKEKQNVSYNREMEKEIEKDIITPYEEPNNLEEPSEELVNNLTNEQISTPLKEEAPAPSVEDVCFRPSYEEEIKEEPFERINEDEVHEETILNDFIQDEQPEIEEINEDVSVDKQDHTVLETIEKKESEEDLVEELETYIPRSSNYSTADEDEGTDNGVDIDYDVR